MRYAHAIIGLGMAGSLLAGGVAETALAAGGDDPEWPCVQRKVPHISIGQMWNGPSVPEGQNWRDDREIARLASHIAARRTSLDDARTMIADFAAKAGADRNARLALLFSGIFSIIDHDRAALIEGIGRYAQRQASTAAKINAERKAIHDLQAQTAPDDYGALDALEEREDQLTWETRIYEERRHSLTYVCESPVFLEKRAFEIGRMIAAELTPQ